MSRYKSMSPFRMVFCFLAISMGTAAAPMPFWDTWVLTSTTFHPRGLTLVRDLMDHFATPVCTSRPRDRWVSISYFVLEASSGFAMAIIVVLLLLYRRSELHEVWKLHRRIKFHVALTTIALMGNILITVAGSLIVVNGGPFWLIIVSWILRYTHIALDTLVLYIALETPVFHLESDCQDSGGVDVHPEVSLRC